MNETTLRQIIREELEPLYEHLESIRVEQARQADELEYLHERLDALARNLPEYLSRLEAREEEIRERKKTAARIAEHFARRRTA